MEKDFIKLFEAYLYEKGHFFIEKSSFEELIDNYKDVFEYKILFDEENSFNELFDENDIAKINREIESKKIIESYSKKYREAMNNLTDEYLNMLYFNSNDIIKVKSLTNKKSA